MNWRNKRITGTVLVVIGAAFAGLAFLVNNSVPGSLQGQVVKELCISGEQHPNYNKWTNVTESTTKVYYWHIKNKEGFLYKRELPQLEERGPYVYRTRSKKIEVSFDQTGKVTYKTFKQHQFNKEMTSKLCPTCQENDKLNIISLAHLGLLSKAKTLDAFSTIFIPTAMKNLLRDIDAKLGSRNATLSQLGNIKTKASPVNCSCNPAFGPWMKSNPKYKGLLYMLGLNNFTTTEMRGLYGALLNPAVMGPPQDKAVYARCILTPHLEECGLYMWLKGLDQYKANLPNISQTFNESEAKRLIDKSLCPSPSACFKAKASQAPPGFPPAGFFLRLRRSIPPPIGPQVGPPVGPQVGPPVGPTNHIADNLLRAVFEFIDTALRGYVLWSTDQNYGLLPTRHQSELALGYVMDKFAYPPSFPNGLPVPGVLQGHSSYQDAIERSDSVTLHSCNSSSSEEYKYSWAAYNGKAEVDQAMFPNASKSDLKVGGHQSLFFPAKNAKTCGSSSRQPAAKEYEMFIPGIKRKIKVMHKESVVVKDLNLERYEVGKDLMTVNNRTVFAPGLLDMTGARGFPVLIGFPRFLHGERGLGQRVGIPAGNPEKHGSFVDIDPFTGMALNAVIRFQVSTVVSSGMVTSQVHPKPLNVSYVEDNAPSYRNVIPLYWTETTQEVSEQQAKEMNDKVFSTLRRSCILMIAMSVVAAICLFFGVIFIALSVKVGNTVSVEISN